MVLLGASILYLVINNPNIPPAGAISTALGVAAGGALWRYGRTAPRPAQVATALLVALITGLGQPEPWVTQELSFSFFIAPTVAVMLTSAVWIAVTSALQLGCFLVRSDFSGVYTDPTNLILIAMVNVGMIAARQAHDLALDAERRRHAERERIDRLHRLITSQVAEALLLVGRDRVVRFANPAARDRLGVSGRTEDGFRTTDLTAPEDAEGLERLLAAAEEGTAGALTLPLRTADGTLRWFDARASRFDDEGESLVLVLARDIDDERKLKARLEEAQRLESIGRLAGGIAHDFNNILTSIQAAAHLALESVPPGSAIAQDLADIQTGADRAAALTHQLLAFARRQVMQTRPVDLDTTIAGVEALTRGVSVDKVRVRFDGCTSGVVVRADPAQIDRVVLNLVVNGRDAMPEGGEVRVSTRAVTVEAGHPLGLAPGTYGVVEVRDDGPGMSPEVLARAFEPYFTTKPPGKGTGLGLSTSYGIAQQHGGTLELESAPGRGTVARLYLPVTDAAPVAQELRPPTSTALTPLARVLLVEDDAFVRRYAARTLRERGFEVDEAENGDSALALARGAPLPWDLLVTDVNMPRLSGPALAARLLSDRMIRRVVFISGLDEAAGSAEDGPEGRLLRKPFSMDQLFDVLLAALSGDAGPVEPPRPTA